MRVSRYASSEKDKRAVYGAAGSRALSKLANL